jgi:curved DNA-binding protein CbpA
MATMPDSNKNNIFLDNTIDERNHYAVLNVRNFASVDEIKRAYKIQSLKLHPDKNRDNIEEATAAFDSLKKSYDILKDQSLKNQHDIYLRAQIQSKERFLELNESRKRFRDNLNANEASSSTTLFSQQNKKKIRLNNLRQESEAALASFNLIEEKKLMKKMNHLSSSNEDDATREYKKNSAYGIIIVKWNKKKILYNEKQLKDIFLRFGKIEFIRIGSKQKSAILQFYHLSSAKLACEYFSSPLNKKRCKLTVILKNSTNKNSNTKEENIDKEQKQTLKMDSFSSCDTTTTINGENNCSSNSNTNDNNSSNTSTKLEPQESNKKTCLDGDSKNINVSRKFNSFEDDVMARLQKAAGL